MSDLIVKDNALMNASYNLEAKELTQMTLLQFMQRVISINLV